MDLKIAVVGATGNVGREILNVLAERAFPTTQVTAFASPDSVGTELSFGESTLRTHDLGTAIFDEFDLCLMSAGKSVSRDYTPKFASAGCIVIDNSSQWRMDPRIPLVVPEVNASALDKVTEHRIVANPNCATIQLVVALKPLHDLARIKRVVFATYQSVSGAGKAAIDGLFAETRSVFVADPITAGAFPTRIAFNVIPQIDEFMEDGDTREEWKMLVETKKILDRSIRVTGTCVRVPVFVGHAISVNIEFINSINAEEARKTLRSAPGCLLHDRLETNGYSTPVDCAGEDAVYISRVREDSSVENGLNMWIVADNLRKGAATNAVQIAEVLINRGLIR